MDNYRLEAVKQYEQALKAGQKYYRAAVRRGEYPYPTALDDLGVSDSMLNRQELGTIDIPIELVTGTRSAGRIAALAGNFMPLLPEGTEFASKWISLCAAHLEEGIREPIRCVEYMGRFYIQEGNKRLSVLKSLDAPTVRANVLRLIPPWSEEPEIRAYYEFLAFYRLAGIYGVEIHSRRGYERLQAELGYEEDHVWTEDERRKFLGGYDRFRTEYEKLNTERLPMTAGEALLEWLKVFPFSDTGESTAVISKSLSSIWPDLRAAAKQIPPEIKTEPEPESRSLVSRVISKTLARKLKAAFIYAFDPEKSQWTYAHELGRRHVEEVMSGRVTTAAYRIQDRDVFAALEQAVADGADVIFATTPAMIEACRRTAALHKGVKVFNCSLSQAYAGVKTYYPRTYETKFLTGVIAGAMAGDAPIGYIANYPIAGVTADINAFALGVRLTNPDSRIKLVWSCLPGSPVKDLRTQGVRIISNRNAADPERAHYAMEWGTYITSEDGTLRPLAAPCWNWSGFYEQILSQILDGVWPDTPADKAVNYWWGLQSGVLDMVLDESLPEGVAALASMLRNDIACGLLDPFSRKITDNTGTVRSSGDKVFPPSELMALDWLSDAVDGRIPAFDEILPFSRELTRMLGIYREDIPPAVKGASK